LRRIALQHENTCGSVENGKFPLFPDKSGFKRTSRVDGQALDNILDVNALAANTKYSVSVLVFHRVDPKGKTYIRISDGEWQTRTKSFVSLSAESTHLWEPVSVEFETGSYKCISKTFLTLKIAEALVKIKFCARAKMLVHILGPPVYEYTYIQMMAFVVQYTGPKCQSKSRI
jgi:hypothetical protein